MKILLAYCGHVLKAVKDIALEESIELVGAATFTEAQSILSRGVDGAIINYHMHEKEVLLNSPQDDAYSSIPWGLMLAVEAQESNIPFRIITDSRKTEERSRFTQLFFARMRRPTPQLKTVGKSPYRARDVYYDLRVEMNYKVPQVTTVKVRTGQR